MKPIELTAELLLPFFNGTKRHAGYSETVKLYNSLRVHADGEYPEALIDTRRPYEAEEAKKYRKEIYQPLTEDAVDRVISSLGKIRRSTDWTVMHDNSAYPERITEKERLDYYTEKNFPISETLEGWLFGVCLKSYLLDANGVILTRPLSKVEETNEYPRPVPWFFNSSRVLEFRPEELLVLAMTESAEKGWDKSTYNEPPRFLVANTITTEIWQQKEGGGYEVVDEDKHNLGVLPGFRAGGKYYKTVQSNAILKSRIAPMVPRLNEAAREGSDLQAEVVLHVHSEKWAFASDKCGTCQDAAGVPRGVINDISGAKKITCPSCGGNRTIGSSPYKTIMVRPTNENLGEKAAPIPPAGYIEKSTEIVKIQDERVDKHIHKALASLNMQFLDQTPLNISGKGKEVDRDELNNFVYSVAEDLVRIADQFFIRAALFRYKEIAGAEVALSLVPNIPVPEKFDILSSNYLTEEIKSVKDANVNPVISNALEIEYANKKFYTDKTVKERVHLVLTLDPLPGMDADSKLLTLSSGGVSRLDFVVSSNINQLVEEAMRSDAFLTLDREKQIAKIQELGEAKLATIDQGRIELPGEVENPNPEGGTPEDLGTFEGLKIQKGERGGAYVVKSGSKVYIKKDEAGEYVVRKQAE